MLTNIFQSGRKQRPDKKELLRGLWALRHRRILTLFYWLFGFRLNIQSRCFFTCFPVHAQCLRLVQLNQAHLCVVVSPAWFSSRRYRVCLHLLFQSSDVVASKKDRLRMHAPSGPDGHTKLLSLFAYIYMYIYICIYIYIYTRASSIQSIFQKTSCTQPSASSEVRRPRSGAWPVQPSALLARRRSERFRGALGVCQARKPPETPIYPLIIWVPLIL